MSKTTKHNNKHLHYFSELSDYKISSNDQDIRGWVVKDRDNRVVGKVDNLLVNLELEKVVYLDVAVDSTIIEAGHDPYGTPSNDNLREFINKEGENHIIIPIGLVGFNIDQKFVHTNTINYQTFAETKRYQSGTEIDRHYEKNVLSSYSRDRESAIEGNEKIRSRRDSNKPVNEGRHRGMTINSLSDEEIRRKEIEEREHPRHEPAQEPDATAHPDTSFDKELRSEKENKEKDHLFYDREEFYNSEFKGRKES